MLSVELAWRVSLAHNGRVAYEGHQSQAITVRARRECRWDETVALAVDIDECNPSTCLLLDLVDRRTGEVVAGSTLSLYEEVEGRHVLRQGHYKVRLWAGTPAECPSQKEGGGGGWQCGSDGMSFTYGREYANLPLLEKWLKEYEDGVVDPECFQQKIKPEHVYKLQRQESASSSTTYVNVALPLFPHAIVYADLVGHCRRLYS